MADISKIKKIKDRVYSLLEKYERTRNDDKLLTVYYWYTFQRSLLHKNGDEWAVNLRNVPRLYSEDKIARVRRKIQNEEGRFYPTDPEVAKKRGIEMERWYEWARQRNDHL